MRSTTLALHKRYAEIVMKETHSLHQHPTRLFCMALRSFLRISQYILHVDHFTFLQKFDEQNSFFVPKKIVAMIF